MVYSFSGVAALRAGVFDWGRRRNSTGQDGALEEQCCSLLMHGLDEDLQNKLSGMNDVGEMEHVAEEVILRLRVTADRMKILGRD